MASRTRLLGLVALTMAVSTAFADGSSKVSIEAQRRDIREVITSLAEQARVKVVLQPEVRGLLSTTIRATPFEQALTVVAATHGYRWRKVGEVYHVGRFSGETEQQATATETITLHHYDARTIARAFGWLDLESVDEPAPAIDLRKLLPPGLDGPPRPGDDNTSLVASGKVQAVADLKYLLARLESGATVKYEVFVAKLTPEAVKPLPVYWAKGEMAIGVSPGREALYSAGDFWSLLARVRAGREGVTPLVSESLPSFDLGSVKLQADAAGCQVDLHWAGRVEQGLSLALWLQGTVMVDGTAVPFQIDAAKLPPEEGVVMVSRAVLGEDGPAPVLLILLPMVTASEAGGE